MDEKFDGDILPKNSITLTDLINQMGFDEERGAITTFTGLVRSISDNAEKKVVAMEVESWTEKGRESMQKIARRIGEKYGLLGMRLVHLTGRIEIGEVIVLIVLSSIHRKEAFSALEETINAYKNESPVWKKEIYDDGSGEWITTAH